MKTIRALMLIAALGSGMVLLQSCARSDRAQESAPNNSAVVKEVAADATARVADSWDSIKGYAYEQRDALAASVNRMADQYDSDIRDLNAKVTGLPDAAAKDRDLAIKQFRAAHARLKDQLADLRTGSADSWADSKARVAQAWQRLQAAYEKARASPTS